MESPSGEQRRLLAADTRIGATHAHGGRRVIQVFCYALNSCVAILFWSRSAHHWFYCREHSLGFVQVRNFVTEVARCILYRPREPRRRRRRIYRRHR